jgi:hypothetical protein
MRKRNRVIVYQLSNIIPDQPGTIHPKGCVTGCVGHVKYYRSGKVHVGEIIVTNRCLANSLPPHINYLSISLSRIIIHEMLKQIFGFVSMLS